MTHIYEDVEDENYFRKVLGNMLRKAEPAKSHKLSLVRFGETGKGITPHYMVIDATNKTHIFNGKSHETFTASCDEKFSEKNLSPALTFTQVQQEIDKRRSLR